MSTLEEEFEAAPIKHIVIPLRGPRGDRQYFDPGKAIEGAYKVVGNEVIMVDARGKEVVDHDGRRYRRRFSNKSGELNEREAASRLTKDVKASLKIAGGDRVGGFEPGPLRYPKGFGGSFY
jgi:hypothetical protein